MAFIEGALSDAATLHVSSHLESCPTCTADRNWFTTVGDDFQAMGDALVAHVPEINIVESVMNALAALDAEQHEKAARLIPMRPRRKGLFASHWLALAAAASIMIAVGLLAYDVGFFSGAVDVKTATGPAHVVSPSEKDTGLPPALSAPLRVANLPHIDLPRPSTESFEALPPARVVLPTSRDIVSAFLEANRDLDAEAYANLAQWASLSEEEARAVTLEGGDSPEAVVGASMFIDDADASIRLMTVVSEMPDEPYLRLKLAGALRNQAGREEEAQGQLEALGQLDPDNALVDYLEALRLLRLGDIEGALTALGRAKEKESAKAYALEGARFREQALIARGVDPTDARLLAAMTAGQNEYIELTGLADEFLEFGRLFESEGDYDTARKIFEAVTNMGGQISGTALFSLEQLAGFDIQRAGLDELEELDSVQDLIDAAQTPLDFLGVYAELAFGIEGLGAFVNELMSVLAGDPGSAQDLSGAILQDGDLSLFKQ